MSAARWLEEPERGNRWVATGFIWLASRLSRPVSRALLYPIAFYYLLTAPAARRAVRGFLGRVTSAGVGWLAVLRQFHNFASVILDRIYVLRGRLQLFDLRIYGAEHVVRTLATGRGCVLLGSHLGSFEIARAAASVLPEVPLRIVMHEVNAPLAQALTRRLNPEAAAAVIPAGTPETMLRVKECLDRGGMVGLLGDRVLDEQRAGRCQFFGAPALFTDSALRLAAALDTPIILFFGLYRGANRYDIHFEPFADKIVLTAADRSAELQRWLQQYAQRLEYYCRLAPDNWFNFFEFWDEHA